MANVSATIIGHKGTEMGPPGGSPTLQSGGQNQRWPTSGLGGYMTPAAWGVPNASERGTKSAVAHTWAHWLHACIFSKIGNFVLCGRVA